MKTVDAAIKAGWLSGGDASGRRPRGWRETSRARWAYRGSKRQRTSRFTWMRYRDKKFDAPAQHVVVDQKKMESIRTWWWCYRERRWTSRTAMRSGNNVYWPSISGNKKLTHNLGYAAEG